MIVFLSFAPIEFMGGAEKMMYKLAAFIKKNEDVVIINADTSIANIYGSVVLQRNFPERMTQIEKQNFPPKIKIHFGDFIPYSKGWKNIRKQLVTARLIYIKYEILEVFFLFYFGGLTIRKKTIASLHSPLLYDDEPRKLSDRLHTLIYSSQFNQIVLKQMKKIHVLNIRDELYLQKTCRFKNVVRIPNSLPITREQKNQSGFLHRDKLSVLFVGELSLRKGADILIELIQNVSDNYMFSVAGDGPLRDELIAKCKEKTNWKYYGFLQEDKLQQLYTKNDILFAPSRAEGLSLVMLEALSHGLKLVGYHTILSDFSDMAKSSSKHNLVKEYEAILMKIAINKKSSGYFQTKQKIKKYFMENFSDAKILPIIQQEIFAITQ
jgi:glycosyltransferase involved in cell wall biosynthesis